MRAWLIYGAKEAEHNRTYIEFYLEEGKQIGMEIKLIIADHLQFGVKNNELFLEYMQKKVQMPDFVICRIIYPLLSKHMECMGIKVFNNSLIADICNDKAKTYQYVAKCGVKMIDTSFCKRDFLDDQLRDMKENTVIKSISGHGGQEVFLWEKKESANIQDALKYCDTVIQPLTGNKHQDLRVYVIGNKIIASVLRTAGEGFKANYSLGGQVHLYQLTKVEQEVVKRIIDLFDFGFVGIDFLIGNDGELIFNEIEDVVGSRMLYHCAEINVVKLYLEYIRTKL